jgi:hypothetical protein
MKIEKIQTAKLIPYARNAKKHDDNQVAKLAGSIREFGFNNPVLIDKDNGIIAGHGRVMAAQKLELAEVPCIRLGHLTDTQRRAYILADNKLSEIGGGYDEEMLALEISELREVDFDLDLIGLDANQIESILNPPEPVTDPTAEWQGMPEFEQEAKSAFREVIVRFENNDDFEKFAKVIGQDLTENTKSIWFPKQDQDQNNRDFVYDTNQEE